MKVQRGDGDVAISPLAERIGEPLHILQCPVVRPGEAGLEDLECRPEPPGRHPHVVDALDVARVEDPLGVFGELEARTDTIFAAASA